MTPERIAELKRLCDAATEGPWMVSGQVGKIEGHRTHSIIHYIEDKKADETIAVVWYDKNTHLGFTDAAFIAAAREALPEAIAEVERLTVERDAAMMALDEIAKVAHDNSTGPAIPDILWSIRDMAYRASETVDETLSRLRREATLEPKP
jgi:hypothetical protein